MREARKKEINGIAFQVSPFMVVEALRLKFYLAGILGPGMLELISGYNVSNTKKIEDLDLSSINLAGALEKLLSNLDENTFIALIKRLFQNVVATWTANGKSHAMALNSDFEVAMNLVFDGKIFTIYPLIAFILEVNYPDFFEVVVRGIGKKIRTITSSLVDEPILKSESEPLET
ncbi:MAG: hypothetical protein LBO67_04815 [Spirochaetaceae bacterium]|jgi:hypothetical protein|nr:hypothetical protein [Spirochaetaceae bacterium]